MPDYTCRITHAGLHGLHELHGITVLRDYGRVITCSYWRYNDYCNYCNHEMLQIQEKYKI